MPKDKNPGLPARPKSVPIIGQKFSEKDNEIINAAVQAIIQKVEPILNGIGSMVDAMDKRLAVVEEVKKIFPDKVEVTIKHEQRPFTALEKQCAEAIAKGCLGDWDKRKKEEKK